MDSPDNRGLSEVRVNAICNALKRQREVQADEVVNLVGTLAEKESEIEALKKRIAELEEPTAQ